MQRIFLSNISKYIGESVTLAGWAYNFRSSGSIYFLQLRDGSGRIQCVISKKEVTDATWDACQKLTIESSVIVKGVVHEDKRSSTGYEMKVESVEVVAIAEEYPIGKKEHGTDFLMDNRHLWLRSSRQEAILKIRDEIIFSWREFFRTKGFILTDSPIFTPNACEGTSTLFATDY
ncbi:MAG: OB-fold nucleic acid binding domain-containing protein, partial [bacterium]|nr:OB-fold nucleic acid binding domain-containing protein [bacterium]